MNITTKPAGRFGPFRTIGLAALIAAGLMSTQASQFSGSDPNTKTTTAVIQAQHEPAVIANDHTPPIAPPDQLAFEKTIGDAKIYTDVGQPANLAASPQIKFTQHPAIGFAYTMVTPAAEANASPQNTGQLAAKNIGVIQERAIEASPQHVAVINAGTNIRTKHDTGQIALNSSIAGAKIAERDAGTVQSAGQFTTADAASNQHEQSHPVGQVRRLASTRSSVGAGVSSSVGRGFGPSSKSLRLLNREDHQRLFYFYKSFSCPSFNSKPKCS